MNIDELAFAAWLVATLLSSWGIGRCISSNIDGCSDHLVYFAQISNLIVQFFILLFLSSWLTDFWAMEPNFSFRHAAKALAVLQGVFIAWIFVFRNSWLDERTKRRRRNR